jgi:hypothetical protein
LNYGATYSHRLPERCEAISFAKTADVSSTSHVWANLGARGTPDPPDASSEKLPALLRELNRRGFLELGTSQVASGEGRIAASPVSHQCPKTLSDEPDEAILQRRADATVWPTLSGGCHLGRDTEAALESGGFRIERVDRFEFSVSALDPKKTHILGTARRI